MTRAAFALLALAAVAHAQEAPPDADRVPRDLLAVEHAARAEGRPAPLKVIARRATAVRRAPAVDAPVRRAVGPMEFFFVLPAPGGATRLTDAAGARWYRVATREVVPQGEQFGWLPADDCVEWWHREAVGLLPRAGGRQRARFYADPTRWQDGFTRWPDPPEHDEAALGLEPARLGRAGFVMPVLEAREGVTLDLDGSVHDLYRVAFIAAPAGAPAPPPREALREALGDFLVDVVFVVDVSGSMRPYIDAVRQAIARVTDDLRGRHGDLRGRFRFGLVTFRGPGEADVVCRLEEGRDHGRFLARVGALEDGGGVDHGEDVLSGIKLALTGVDWCDLGFKQVVLVGDEAAFDQDNHPERNGSGMSIPELLALAQPVQGAVRPLDALRVCRVITTVEVQREVNGPRLDALRTRQFSQLAGLGEGVPFPGEALRFAPGEVQGMRDALVADLGRRIEGARAVVGLVEGEALPHGRVDDDPRFAGVPAPFRELIELLRPDDAAAEGLPPVPVRDAWLSSFDAFGAATVTERFLVSRARLRRLQQVADLVAHELEQPGVNPGVLVQMLQQRLAAMSIDHDLAPTTPLSVVLEIVGGLPIRTPLMTLTPEQVAAMSPADRARVTDKLARMARLFGEQLAEPALWFKLDPTDEARDALAFVAIDDVR
ncbi:MAG: VWA domain-containing protein [Planctomycetes bacterium]|nr:VWA domain-containing protein [Planctomycetota bacterium]